METPSLIRLAETFRSWQCEATRVFARSRHLRTWFGHKATAPEIKASARRTSLEHQWGKLSHYLDDQHERATALVEVQSTAARHLDAAHYALDRIALELVDVMPSITQVARIEPGNVVHFDQPVPAGLRSVEDIEAVAA